MLSGCCGIGAMISTGDSVRVDCPLISKKRGIVGGEKTKCAVKSSEIEKYWGKPDSVEKLVPEGELWIYKESDSKWIGGGCLAGCIPIPLFVPVGRKKVSLAIEDGCVKSAIADGTEQKAAYCITGFTGHGFNTGCEYDVNPVRSHFITPGDAIAKCNLFINAKPKNAETNIANIDIPYSPGVELDSGKYTIEVSRGK